VYLHTHRTPYLLIAGLVLAVVLPVPGRAPVIAQSADEEWTEPIQLDAAADGIGSFARVANDAAGNLHVVWNAWVGPDRPSIWAANTIYYVWWNGEQWSQPADILAASSAAGVLQAGSVAATSDGYLVVAWTENDVVNVSRAPVERASLASAWDTVRVDTGSNARLAIDSLSGRWLLTFGVEAKYVLLRYSDDLGRSWSVSRVVWSAPSDASAVINQGVYVAGDGSVHMVWSEHVRRRNWGGEAVWHARIPPLGAGAFEVREVARSVDMDEPTLDSPVMALNPIGELHLFWNNGVGSTTGRFHQWSSDYGETWSDVHAVFPGLSGQTAPAGLIFDSGDTLHLVSAADGFGYGYAVLRYATWKNGQWSEFTTLWPEIFPGEHPALAITGGNRLHLFWDFFDHLPNGDLATKVMYSSLRLDAPFVQPQGFTERAEASDASHETAPGLSTPELPEPIPGERPGLAAAVATPMPLQDSDALRANPSPLVVGVGSAAVLLCAIVALFVFQRSRWR